MDRKELDQSPIQSKKTNKSEEQLMQAGIIEAVSEESSKEEENSQGQEVSPPKKHQKIVQQQQQQQIHYEQNTIPESNEMVEDIDEFKLESQILENYSQNITADYDSQKLANNSSLLFNNLNPSPGMDPSYKDFPARSAMKGHVQLEYKAMKIQRDHEKKQHEQQKQNQNQSQQQQQQSQQSKSNNNKVGQPRMGHADHKLLISDEVFSPATSESAPNQSKRNKQDEYKQDLEESPIQEEEQQEFQGNIKGLLKKSREKKQMMSQEYDSQDLRSTPPQDRINHNRGGTIPRQDFNSELPLNNPLDRTRQRLANPLAKNQNNPLPPVNTKSVKNFNKSATNWAQQAEQQKFMQQSYQGGFNNQQQQPWDAQYQDEEEGESVEEIVYHVNEEGFLVDENGNLLIDDQGNYLKLSPDQMRDLQENDLVYAKDY